MSTRPGTETVWVKSDGIASRLPCSICHWPSRLSDCRGKTGLSEASPDEVPHTTVQSRKRLRTAQRWRETGVASLVRTCMVEYRWGIDNRSTAFLHQKTLRVCNVWRGDGQTQATPQGGCNREDCVGSYGGLSRTLNGTASGDQSSAFCKLACSQRGDASFFVFFSFFRLTERTDK